MRCRLIRLDSERVLGYLTFVRYTPMVLRRNYSTVSDIHPPGDVFDRWYSGGRGARAVVLQARRVNFATLLRQPRSLDVGYRGGVVVRILASHPGEPGSITGGVAPGFSHVGIVPDDAAGWRLSRGSPVFPRLFILALLHTHPRFIGSQDNCSHRCSSVRMSAARLVSHLRADGSHVISATGVTGGNSPLRSATIG
ncbi:hypothetical protein PR048_027843 [Dryococelus australis]|uniref:Uncharacterized protein n=1 Tax=Dryococelus australis TaxID=614101 RepID=A0ABQ9GHK5_9NEOP|nr:hypothetical protein PR048_027843 [Dryococelus australis]